jgi:biopolymer transport protein ExbD
MPDMNVTPLVDAVLVLIIFMVVAPRMLSDRHAEEPLRRLALRADAKLTYGQVREILARTQQVGFPGMSLMVGERSRKGAAREQAAPEAAPADEQG